MRKQIGTKETARLGLWKEVAQDTHQENEIGPPSYPMYKNKLKMD